MKWKDAVHFAISQMAAEKNSNILSRQEIITQKLGWIKKSVGSTGLTPHQTLSRILQELAEDQVLEFVESGSYRLIDSVNNPRPTEQSYAPTERKLTYTERIVRNSSMATDLKRLYGFRCQFCGLRLELKSGYCCEAHHIKPLGKPHDGPDIVENLIIVCPNHHSLLDFGAITITRKQLQLVFHEFDQELLRYHNQILAA